MRNNRAPFADAGMVHRCACRKPTAATHRGRGFTVSLNRGFGTYYASYINTAGALVYTNVPRTIRNSWQRAVEWCERNITDIQR